MEYVGHVVVMIALSICAGYIVAQCIRRTASWFPSASMLAGGVLGSVNANILLYLNQLIPYAALPKGLWLAVYAVTYFGTLGFFLFDDGTWRKRLKRKTSAAKERLLARVRALAPTPQPAPVYVPVPVHSR